MSVRMSVTGYRWITRLQFHNLSNYMVYKNQSFSLNPLFSTQSTPSSSFLKSRTLHYVRNHGTTAQTKKKSIRDFGIHSSSDHQDIMTTFGSFLASWKSWIIGGLMTAVLPFLPNKWGPLLKWTKFSEELEEAEEITEAVEKVAVGVEKIAEDIVENLPEGSRLKTAVTSVENAAKEVVKDADIVEDLIHKAEAVEKKVEAILDGKPKQRRRQTSTLIN